jgi:hypothetical protein
MLQWAEWIWAKESQIPNLKVSNHWNLGVYDNNMEADGPQTPWFVRFKLVFKPTPNYSVHFSLRTDTKLFSSF